MSTTPAAGERSGVWPIDRSSMSGIKVSIKRCTRCGEEKEASAFNKDRTSSDGLYAYCKDCRRVLRKERYPHDPEAGYFKSIKRRYNLSREDYEEMLAYQGGKCGICGCDPTTLEGVPLQYQRLHVDHWHDDLEAVRGLLCYNCNFGVGRWLDNPQLLEAAVTYLGDHWHKKAA